MNVNEVDFSKSPMKGIFAEIGRELGVHHVTVREGFLRKSPKYVPLVKEKVKQRLAAIDPIIELEREAV